MRAILRKAEHKPEILISDPARRRARGRRAAVVQVPLYSAAGAVVGYLVGGWVAALVMAVLLGVSAGLGAWWYLRREA